MADVVRVRWDNDWWWNTPPRDWYMVHGYIASPRCEQVGNTATLVAGGQEYRVLVADCGERDKHGEGQHWMESNNIAAELDWKLFQRLTALHGKPLEIEVRY